MVKVHIPYTEAVTNFEDKKGLRIDPNNIKKMFYMVTEAPYKNPLGTVVREYLSNALDEHVTLDIKKPIEIYLPSVLEPTLSIKDYGRGMNKKFIEEEFCSFGCTTKEDTDDAIGGWGVGGKSFAALTDEVLFCTVQDNIKVIFTMYKDKEMALCYNILSEEFTEECNGTTVRINIDLKLHEQCKKEVAYWTEYLPVPIEITPPLFSSYYEKVDSTSLAKGNDWEIFKGNDHYKTFKNPIIVLIGGLKYPVNSNETLIQSNNKHLNKKDIKILSALKGSYNYYNFTYQVVLNLKPGLLDLTVGREDLRYSNNTIDTLCKELHRVIGELRHIVTESINSKENLWEASLEFNKSKSLYQALDIKYKGDQELVSKSPEIDKLYYVTLSSNNKVIKKDKYCICCEDKEADILYDDLLEKDSDLSFTKRTRLLNSRIRKFFEDNPEANFLYLIGQGNNLDSDWKEMLNPILVSSLPNSNKKINSSSTTNKTSNKNSPNTKPSNKDLITLRKWVGAHEENSINLWKYCKSVEIDPKVTKAFYFISHKGSLGNKKEVEDKDKDSSINKIFKVYVEDLNLINGSLKFIESLSKYKDYKSLLLIKESQRDKLIKEGADLIEYTNFIPNRLINLISLGQCLEIFKGNKSEMLEALQELIEFYKVPEEEVPDWLRFYINLNDRLEFIRLRIKVLINEIKCPYYSRWSNITTDDMLSITFKRLDKVFTLNSFMRSVYYKNFKSSLLEKVGTEKKFYNLLILLDTDFKINGSTNLPFEGDVEKYINHLIKVSKLHEDAIDYLFG